MSAPLDAGRRDPLPVRLTIALADRILARYGADFRHRYAAAAREHVADLGRATYREKGMFALLALLPRLLWDLRPRGDYRARSNTFPPRKRGLPMFETTLQDLRFARRAMARRPGTTALAALILALGIGSSVSMFSVLDAVMLRPLPYPDSDRIMSLYLSIDAWRDNPTLAADWRRTRWEYQEFVDWRDRQHSFERAGLLGQASATLTGFDVAERVRVGMAGTQLFEVFGAVPYHGRFFEPADATNDRVVVVSHAFWESHLGANAQVIGDSLVLDGFAYTVIGVLPPGFEVSLVTADLWIPVFGNRPGGYFPGNTGDMNHVFLAMGLLRDDTTPQGAEEEISMLLSAIEEGDHFTRHTGTVMPRLLDETRAVRAPMALLMGAVFLLLVIACANVATVLLGQAIDRRQEIAVRSAIGAGHGRITRQLLTESVLLGLLSGAGGLVLARAGISSLSAAVPAYLPRVDAIRLDLRAAAFAVAVSLLASLLFGLAPALSLGGGRLARAMGSSRSGTVAGSRLQSAIVIAEIAVATVFLVGAGLLLRSFNRLNAVDPGFDAENVLMLQLSMDSRAFVAPNGEFDDGAMRSRIDAIAGELRSLPGVRDVAIAASPPFSYYSANNSILPEGHEPPEGEFWLADRRFVQPGYFAIMRVPLLEGRFLEARDDRPGAASVVVVTENLADRFWPGESAVGKRIGWWGQESVVVGVIPEVREFALDQQPRMQLYAAPAAFSQAGGFLMIGTDDAGASLAQVRDTLVRVAPELPIARLEPVEQAIAGSLDEARFRTRLIALFAAVAAALSITGLYGVTSRAVAGRSRELGLRMALGANQTSVIGLVLRRGIRLAVAGAAAGVLLSIAGTRVLESFLYDVEPNDPFTLGIIVTGVTGMAIVASLVPSVRASRVDPVEVLRR